MSVSLQKSHRGDLDHETVRQAYKRWAPVYDVIFGSVFESGRTLAINAVNRLDGRVLEVGVGTGLALPRYKRDLDVTGIDLSHDMLLRAQERVRDDTLTNVRGLSVMDASRMAFADGSFDGAVAMFLITTVPDPEGVLAEMVRVVRPGGEIVLVNHFAAPKGPLAMFERALAHRSRSLGWRPDFPIERVMGNAELELMECRQVGPLGIFTLLRFQRRMLAEEILEPVVQGVA